MIVAAMLRQQLPAAAVRLRVCDRRLRRACHFREPAACLACESPVARADLCVALRDFVPVPIFKANANPEMSSPGARSCSPGVSCVPRRMIACLAS